jgi:hypothetical protein
LSERILRVLILRGDHVTPEEMAKDTPSMLAEKHIVKPPVVEIPALAEEEDEAPEIEKQI